jgi:hypothetical protein
MHGMSIRQMAARATDTIALETLVNAVEKLRFEGIEMSPETYRRFDKTVNIRRRQLGMGGPTAMGGRGGE